MYSNKDSFVGALLLQYCKFTVRLSLSFFVACTAVLSFLDPANLFLFNLRPLQLQYLHCNGNLEMFGRAYCVVFSLFSLPLSFCTETMIYRKNASLGNWKKIAFCKKLFFLSLLFFVSSFSFMRNCGAK